MYDTLIPFDEIEYQGIQYMVCRDFDHISRYRGLRQVVHNPKSLTDRIVTLEIPNKFETKVDTIYHEVTQDETNRLDLVAYRTLGSAQYGWVIAYFNGIEDGFTINPGQTLRIPKQFTSLFEAGEVLAPITPFKLNLGSE